MITKQVMLSFGEGIIITSPRDNELDKFVQDNIPIAFRYPNNASWLCPFSSLPEVIDFLEPKGFLITNGMRSLRARIEAGRNKNNRYEREREAKRILLQRIANDEEVAFVPAANSNLTRKLKSRGAYEVVETTGTFSRQTVGLRVAESDLQSVLLDLGRPIDPESRLQELLNYTYRINDEAKWKRPGLAKQYRYMKKGELLGELCRLATKQNAFRWGWRKDPRPPDNGAEWVVYFEQDGVLYGFHSFGRGNGPAFKFGER